MPATLQELERFHHFALNHINSDGFSYEFDDLVTLWYDSAERAEIDAVLRQGFADIEAGLSRPAREVTAEISRKLGLPLE